MLEIDVGQVAPKSEDLAIGREPFGCRFGQVFFLVIPHVPDGLTDNEKGESFFSAEREFGGCGQANRDRRLRGWLHDVEGRWFFHFPSLPQTGKVATFPAPAVP